MRLLKVSLMFSLLFIFTFGSYSHPVEASTGTIDAYVKVNSITKNSDGTISINYTMKKDFKTTLYGSIKQNLNFTYNMNSAYKLPEVKKAVNSKKGTYTIKLPKPSPDYLGSQTIYLKYGTTSYSESKRLNVVYNIPSQLRGVKRGYQTITKAQAAGEKIVADYLPGLTVIVLFKGKSPSVKNVAKKATGVASTIVGFNLATGVIKQMPSLSAGYVLYNERELKTNGTVRNRVMVFANKATYNEFVKSNYTKGSLAMYDSNSTSKLGY